MTPEPFDDVEHPTSPALRLALQTVMPGTSGALLGSRLYLPADEGIVALAMQASYGGPLDPITPGSGERWMGVLRDLITIDLNLGVTAARLWFEAQSIRPSPCVEDRAWATHVIAIIELLRGNVGGAERWMSEASEESDNGKVREWISDTCAKLGLSESSSRDRWRRLAPRPSKSRLADR